MSSAPAVCTKIGIYSEKPTSEEVVQLTFEEQGRLLKEKEEECMRRIQTDSHILQGKFCPRLWDRVMCWGDTEPNVTVCQQCPGYINNFKTTQFASRTCLPGAIWDSKPDANVSSSHGWTNYSACYTMPSNMIIPDPGQDVPSVIVDHIKQMRIMYNIGYGISLVSLILAFTIMVYFRKLHCSRNTIHLNLFASFIMRASSSLVKDNFMVGSVGFAGDMAVNSTTGGMVFTEGPHWECRLFSTVFNYTIVSSYMWIFVEAVFLYMLIHVNVMSDKIRVIWYIMIGWTIPLGFVVIWSVMRIVFDNYLCWNTHTRLPGLIWIVQAPIILTVLINILFFISIIRTLYTKLNASKFQDSKHNRYRRMAKSILLLIPVFGVYYVMFTILHMMFTIHTFSETVAFIMLFIEMFFNSYQGFFIAVVLCFINAEVRAEIQRAWAQKRLRSGSLASNRSMSRLNSHHNLRRGTLESCNGLQSNQNTRFSFLRFHRNFGKAKVSDKSAIDEVDKNERVPFIVSNGHDNRQTDVQVNFESNRSEVYRNGEMNETPASQVEFELTDKSDQATALTHLNA